VYHSDILVRDAGLWFGLILVAVMVANRSSVSPKYGECAEKRNSIKHEKP
jgi:hypothetical protein